MDWLGEWESLAACRNIGNGNAAGGNNPHQKSRGKFSFTHLMAESLRHGSKVT